MRARNGPFRVCRRRDPKYDKPPPPPPPAETPKAKKRGPKTKKTAKTTTKTTKTANPAIAKCRKQEAAAMRALAASHFQVHLDYARLAALMDPEHKKEKKPKEAAQAQAQEPASPSSAVGSEFFDISEVKEHADYADGRYYLVSYVDTAFEDEYIAETELSYEALSVYYDKHPNLTKPAAIEQEAEAAIQERAIEQQAGAAVEQRAIEQQAGAAIELAIEERAVEQRAVEEPAVEQRAVEERAIEQHLQEEGAADIAAAQSHIEQVRAEAGEVTNTPTPEPSLGSSEKPTWPTFSSRP